MPITRRSALTSAAAMLASPAFGQGARIDITVYHYQVDRRHEALKQVYAAFEQANPDVRIVDVFRPDASIAADVQAALAARRPVDLATVEGRNVPMFVRTTPAVPIDADPAKAPFLAEHLPNFLSVGRVAGRQYGLPYAFGTALTYRNQSLFRQAGLDPEMPLDHFDQLIEASKVIQERTGAAGLAHNNGPNKDSGAMRMVANAGGEYLSPEGDRLLFDSAPGIEAMQLWQDLAVRHRVMPVATDAQWQAAFFAGRMGIFMGSSAFLRQAVATTQGRFDLRVDQFPRFAAGMARRIPNTGGVFMLYSPEGPRRDAALRFLGFLSRLEVSNLWARESGYMPLVRDPKRDPEMRAYVETFPYVRPVIAQMADTIPTYIWQGRNIPEAQGIVSAMIDELWAGRAPAAQLVPDAVRRANAALGRGA